MSVGARLRRAREEQGLSLDSLSRVTRVTLSILTAIEQDKVDAIPPRPYGRGFVRIYASEVGLDPDQAAAEFFAQFAPPAPPAATPPAPPAPSPPSHSEDFARAVWAWVGRPAVVTIASAILAFVVILAGWGVERAGVPGAVGTAGVSAPSPVGTAGAVARRVSTTPAVDDGVTVALEATGRSWVTASADGRRMIYRTLQPGDREVLHATREIRIRTGNAGGVRWQIGRRAPEPMGKSGEVRTARVTADDVRE